MSNHKWQDWMLCIRCQNRATPFYVLLCESCLERKSCFESTGTCGPPGKSDFMADLTDFVLLGKYPPLEDLKRVPQLKDLKPSLFIRVCESREGFAVIPYIVHIAADRLPNEKQAAETGPEIWVPYSNIAQEVEERKRTCQLLNLYHQGRVTKTELRGLGVEIPSSMAESQTFCRSEQAEATSRFDREDLDV